MLISEELVDGRKLGGVRPRATGPRPSRRLSLVESESISPGAAGRTRSAVAAELGCPVSTLSREVAHNGGPNLDPAARADRLATPRAARSWPGKLADQPQFSRGIFARTPDAAS